MAYLNYLDIETLLTVNLVGQFLSVLIFSYYLLMHRNIRYDIKLYTIAKILQLTCLLLSVVFAGSLTPFIMTLTLLFYYPGLAVEGWCLIHTGGIRTRIKLGHMLILSMVFVIIYAIFSENLIVRVLVTSVYYSAIFLFIFIMLVFSRQSTSMQKFIGWISLLYAGVNLSRGFFTLFSGTEIPMLRQVPIQVLFGIVSMIIAFSFPVLFLLIIKERNMEELERLNDSKDKFFRIIGHDLKGPLGQMVEAASLLESRGDNLNNDAVLRFASAMKESSLRSFRLLENLLAWARSNTGDIQFRPSEISAGALIRETADLLAPQAQAKNISITIDVTKSDRIFADKEMLSTILRNLAGNAVKYTRDGGRIRISGSRDSDMFIFSVTDNGVGMSGNVMKNLFKSNPVSSVPGTRHEKGTGLGLVLCRELIEKHRGTIRADSRPGKGSTFTVVLPLLPAD